VITSCRIAAYHNDAISSIPQEEVDRVIAQQDAKATKRKDDLEELARIQTEIDKIKGQPKENS